MREEKIEERHLFILNKLKGVRCVSRKRSFSCPLMERLFNSKFKRRGTSYKKIKKDLLNWDYICSAGKSPEKYYIANCPKAFTTLTDHGYSTPINREMKK